MEVLVETAETRILKTTARLRYCLGALLLGVVIVVAGVFAHRVPAELRAFRSFVLEPIPESVETVRFSTIRGSFGIAHVFRFKIGREDIDRILQSKPFKMFEWVSYWNYCVHVGLFGASTLDPRQNPLAGVGVESVAIHEHGQELPAWFKMNEWKDPEVFEFHEKLGKANRDHHLILIFNEDLGEAYFIDCRAALE